ncbi:PIG-L deacetylase family protein [Phyllobacterium endophyticum]|uniref:PIG-L domain-containing protein n=1 Tax=Phyllobacterium endophyticum TaxID=1149773 RepID=A0A2P7B124_9HYPH|nr:PIG-L deacetylase family protein [Phyllobacterium endophyticum]MBB3237647.1 LmbE family N-acetylglucosaminyl deacetylase [Phyllobacterium endophyticum]PSH60114.1 PIG-L domain-containing protein [Phyllobacterium endophyticum]TYR42282.1 PIG-L family deacetylase [Phyllobacterium endophyticum]
MRQLPLARRGERLSVLCLGAHSDDIEIGAGGTILRLIEDGVLLDVHWCVLSASGARASEANASALAFLEGAASRRVELANFEDSYFPDQSRTIKHWLNSVRDRISPDVIFTHARDDAHQDHREVNRLTTNVFRDHLVLEYEIPKWDGDLAQHNTYMPLTARIMDRKTQLLLEHFGTQRSKDWFDELTFTGLARLRGMECRAEERFAEAFTNRKLSLSIG